MTSLEALKRACARLGLELRLGQPTFKWYGRWMNDYDAKDAAYKLGIKPEDYGKCEHAIHNPEQPGGYEVGLMKNPNGQGWIAVVDFFGDSNKTHIANKVGRFCEKLAQAYQVEVVKMEHDDLIDAGLTHVTETVDEDGWIQLSYEEA